MAPVDVIVPQPSTSSRPPETPPSSPRLRPCEQVHTLNSGQFQELLKAIQALQIAETPGANTLVSTEDVPSGNKQPVARASKLEFKEVNEM